ncbi:hypothetical protein ESA_03490 [Cronobacter sakazakii ATCC BAA-894]|uniref:Uncharacterized protein n=1 Tax=Cronobacter sakazakii (strain ATCC BAA-894) TaxID=290339 RepID=A7MIT8_CROS8|nr:hypothetical protein ESA_03490 [Cronobacter sakazakii ATCC BAA-894]
MHRFMRFANIPNKASVAGRNIIARDNPMVKTAIKMRLRMYKGVIRFTA